jgi:hypothetical protein
MWKKVRPRLLALTALFGAVSPASAEPLFTTEGGNVLPYVVLWESGPPFQRLAAVQLIGLQQAERTVGIAIRPRTGGLYVLGSSSRLYSVNFVTGLATPVGSPMTPALAGNRFGIAFDNAGALRVVSDAGQNLRVDPDTGVTTVDAVLAYAGGDPNAGKAPDIEAVAYDHRATGAAALTAYGIDNLSGLLVRLGSAAASDGKLSTISPINGFLAGFDISPRSGIAYGLEPGFSSALVTIDLQTGAIHFLATVGGQFEFFAGLAVAPSLSVAEIPTLSGMGAACLALALALASWTVLRLHRRRAALARHP